MHKFKSFKDGWKANFFGYYIKRINWKSNKKREYSIK